jgi:hypothetical protein
MTHSSLSMARRNPSQPSRMYKSQWPGGIPSGLQDLYSLKDRTESLPAIETCTVSMVGRASSWSSRIVRSQRPGGIPPGYQYCTSLDGREEPLPAFSIVPPGYHDCKSLDSQEGFLLVFKTLHVSKARRNPSQPLGLVQS